MDHFDMSFFGYQTTPSGTNIQVDEGFSTADIFSTIQTSNLNFERIETENNISNLDEDGDSFMSDINTSLIALGDINTSLIALGGNSTETESISTTSLGVNNENRLESDSNNNNTRIETLSDNNIPATSNNELYIHYQHQLLSDTIHLVLKEPSSGSIWFKCFNRDIDTKMKNYTYNNHLNSKFTILLESNNYPTNLKTKYENFQYRKMLFYSIDLLKRETVIGILKTDVEYQEEEHKVILKTVPKILGDCIQREFKNPPWRDVNLDALHQGNVMLRCDIYVEANLLLLKLLGFKNDLRTINLINKKNLENVKADPLEHLSNKEEINSLGLQKLMLLKSKFHISFNTLRFVNDFVMTIADKCISLNIMEQEMTYIKETISLDFDPVVIPKSLQNQVSSIVFLSQDKKIEFAFNEREFKHPGNFLKLEIGPTNNNNLQVSSTSFDRDLLETIANSSNVSTTTNNNIDNNSQVSLDLIPSSNNDYNNNNSQVSSTSIETTLGSTRSTSFEKDLGEILINSSNVSNSSQVSSALTPSTNIPTNAANSSDNNNSQTSSSTSIEAMNVISSTNIPTNAANNSDNNSQVSSKRKAETQITKKSKKKSKINKPLILPPTKNPLPKKPLAKKQVVFKQPTKQPMKVQTNNIEPISINPNFNSINGSVADHIEKMKLMTSVDGCYAKIVEILHLILTLAVIAHDLKTSKTPSSYANILKKDVNLIKLMDSIITINIVEDGTPIGKGLVNLNITIIAKGALGDLFKSHSLNSVYPIQLFFGKEGNSELTAQRYKQAVHDIKALLERGIVVEGRHFQIDAIWTPDLKASKGNTICKSYGDSFPCLMCNMPWAVMKSGRMCQHYQLQSRIPQNIYGIAKSMFCYIHFFMRTITKNFKLLLKAGNDIYNIIVEALQEHVNRGGSQLESLLTYLKNKKENTSNGFKNFPSLRGPMCKEILDIIIGILNQLTPDLKNKIKSSLIRSKLQNNDTSSNNTTGSYNDSIFDNFIFQDYINFWVYYSRVANIMELSTEDLKTFYNSSRFNDIVQTVTDLKKQFYFVFTSNEMTHYYHIVFDHFKELVKNLVEWGYSFLKLSNEASEAFNKELRAIFEFNTNRKDNLPWQEMCGVYFEMYIYLQWADKIEEKEYRKSFKIWTSNLFNYDTSFEKIKDQGGQGDILSVVNKLLNLKNSMVSISQKPINCGKPFNSINQKDLFLGESEFSKKLINLIILYTPSARSLFNGISIFISIYFQNKFHYFHFMFARTTKHSDFLKTLNINYQQIYLFENAGELEKKIYSTDINDIKKLDKYFTSGYSTMEEIIESIIKLIMNGSINIAEENETRITTNIQSTSITQSLPTELFKFTDTFGDNKSKNELKELLINNDKIKDLQISLSDADEICYSILNYKQRSNLQSDSPLVQQSAMVMNQSQSITDRVNELFGENGLIKQNYQLFNLSKEHFNILKKNTMNKSHTYCDVCANGKKNCVCEEVCCKNAYTYTPEEIKLKGIMIDVIDMSNTDSETNAANHVDVIEIDY